MEEAQVICKYFPHKCSDKFGKLKGRGPNKFRSFVGFNGFEHFEIKVHQIFASFSWILKILTKLLGAQSPFCAWLYWLHSYSMQVVNIYINVQKQAFIDVLQKSCSEKFCRFMGKHMQQSSLLAKL